MGPDPVEKTTMDVVIMPNNHVRVQILMIGEITQVQDMGIRFPDHVSIFQDSHLTGMMAPPFVRHHREKVNVYALEN